MKRILSTAAFAILSLALFSQGYYIEYKMTASSKDGSGNGSMKTYSQDGNSRSEVSIASPQLAGPMQITSLMLKAEPTKIYMLNDKTKTYSEMATGKDDHAQADYEITVVGKEKVNGYNTTHVTVKVNGMQSQELWTTKDIAGYADFSKIKTKYSGKENLYQALSAKGAEGMPVRIKATDRGQGMQMDLVTAEKRSNPASLFSLAGYAKGSVADGIPGAEGMQEMLKKMQNMTPAERDALIKKMQEQYGKEQH